MQIAYESSKGISFKEGNGIFELLSTELFYSIVSGNAAVAEYLIKIGMKFSMEYWSSPNFHIVFGIKDSVKKKRSLDFLFNVKAPLWTQVFDEQALMGNYENILWFVEHGYKGKFAIEMLEDLEILDEGQQQVLYYLRRHPRWENVGWTSYGNHQGKPHDY